MLRYAPSMISIRCVRMTVYGCSLSNGNPETKPQDNADSCRFDCIKKQWTSDFPLLKHFTNDPEDGSGLFSLYRRMSQALIFSSFQGTF